MTVTSPKPPRGADLLVQALQRAGVKIVFTLSGNHIMPVFDALLGSGIRLIHTRHEAAAVHMADAWARLTGEVGVALVTGGPGHANAVSALYTALMAESPGGAAVGPRPERPARHGRLPGNAPGRHGRPGVQGRLDLRRPRRGGPRPGARRADGPQRPARAGAPEPAERRARTRGRRLVAAPADAFVPAPQPLAEARGAPPAGGPAAGRSGRWSWPAPRR
jgi:acetolactate synthase-1/2/3 large subunit